MGLEIFKNGFINYLQEISEISNKKYNTNNADVSIFMYANEFKNYLTDELNFDSSIFSKSVSEILDMEVKNGKLVDPEEETLTDSFNNEEDTENEILLEEDNNNKEQEFIKQTETMPKETTPQEIGMTDILNNLLQDETVIETLDTDKSGELDEEEVHAFIDTIKGYDGDEEDISLEDILTAAIDIANGDFTLDNKEENTIEEEIKTEDDNQTQTPVSGGQSASSNGISGGSIPSGVQSGGRTAGVTSQQGTEEKTLDNMNKEELNAELSSAQSDLSEKQSTLSAVLDGSDSAISQLEENVNQAYDTYQEQLKLVDEELAEQVDDLKSKIDEQENKIDQKEQEISDQESVVSDSETEYNNAVTTRENLETSLAALKSIDTSEMDSAKLSELNSKISELTTKVETAKRKEEEAKTRWDEAEEKLKQLKEEKEELISGQGGLDELNQQMTELEAEIIEKYPEIKEYLEAYNSAKETYDTEKQTAIANAKAEVQTAQNYVNEVQTAINNFENKETVKDYTMNQYDPEKGNALVDYAWKMLETYGSTQGYCATGVSRTINMAYGISMRGNGCDWDKNMEKLVEQGLFIETTEDYPSSSDLSKLPAGAVVCWPNTTGTGGGGAEFGHVTIADGKGGEISDHYLQNILPSVGGSSENYRIFLPI